MKRLIVLASAIAVAAISQAATVTWGSGAIYLPDADGNWSSTKAGSAAAKKVTAYLFISDSAIADTDFKSYFDYNETTGAITLKDGVAATKTVTTGALGSANTTSTLSAPDNEGDPANVLYTLAFYTFTDTNNKGWYISGTATATMAYGDLVPTVSPTEIAVANGKTAGWTSAAPVPEPTTVALLALGLVAAGLKRKVA